MRNRIVWVALAMIAFVAVAADKALTRSQEKIKEEFHQTYQLSPQGRISLENINGSVRIMGWERNEVKVDAVKWAYTRERLSEAEIMVDATSDSIHISTKYPSGNQTFTDNKQGRLNNPATVEYTLTVPRGARIDAIELINGGINLEGLAGDVRASSINGMVAARGLTGEAKLSTINGNLEATFNQLDAQKPISLASVNGNLTVTIPSDANATIRAGTVHGQINNDFGLPVKKGEYVGSELAGQLGQGGTRIKLGNVNGQITVRRAQDGRPQSQAVNLLTIKEKDKNRDYNMDGINDAISEARQAQRSVTDAQREAARAQREVARAARDAQREMERAGREMSATVGRNASDVSYRLIERDDKSFTVGGVPRVSVESFDGPINVRAWDKQEVSYSATRRASDEEQMQAIRITADQRGDEIIIKAEFDKATANRLGNVQATASFDVYVPRKATLRVFSGDGRLSAEGISGEVTMNTGDGAVEVRGGSGRLNINTGDGQVRVASFDGAVSATTGDGGINLDGRFTRLSAVTGDGAISLSLPGDSNATIETDAEAVTNEGLAVSEDNDELKRVRRWKVGSGGNLLSLKTGDGRIYLRRSGNPQ